LCFPDPFGSTSGASRIALLGDALSLSASNREKQIIREILCIVKNRIYTVKYWPGLALRIHNKLGEVINVKFTGVTFLFVSVSRPSFLTLKIF
jgi:hypothetical protein